MPYELAHIWDLPVIFVFCRVFDVIYNVQMLFDWNIAKNSNFEILQ